MNDNTKAAPQGVASEDKNYPFYELRYIMRVLSHQRGAPEQDWQTAYGMAKAIFARWHKDQIALAQTEQAAPRMGAAVTDAGSERYFDGYLCRAWGETDLPSAEVAHDLSGVRRFMVREWWGEEDPTEYDSDQNMGDRIMREIAERDWREEGQWSATFEIGGVSVEQVTGWTALAASATPGSGEPFAYFIYIPAEQRGELVFELEEATDDLTNCECEITPLYAHPPAASAGDALTDAYRKGFIDGQIDMRASLAQQAGEDARDGGWISVDERLPEQDMCTVLIHATTGLVTQSFCCADPHYFGNNTGTFGKSAHFDHACKYGYEVTHWMPLPPPPAIDQAMKGGEG